MAYLAERYAHLMTKEDLVELFSILEEKCGSTAEACRKCGIQRKTRYDWERTRSVKLSTSRKVLKALIENIMDETLDFFLKRSKETTLELLSLNLSNIYSKAMSESITRSSFVDVISEFEEVKNRYAGLIWELEEEMGDMIYHIRERASAINVPLPAESVDVIKPSHMLEMVPSVVEAINRRAFQSPSEIATSLDVPGKLVQVMSDAVRMPFYTEQLDVTNQTGLRFDIEKPPSAYVQYPVLNILEGQKPWVF